MKFTNLNNNASIKRTNIHMCIHTRGIHSHVTHRSCLYTFYMDLTRMRRINNRFVLLYFIYTESFMDCTHTHTLTDTRENMENSVENPAHIALTHTRTRTRAHSLFPLLRCTVALSYKTNTHTHTHTYIQRDSN